MFHESSAPKLSVQQCLLTQANDPNSTMADFARHRQLCNLKGSLNEKQRHSHVHWSADSAMDRQQA